MDRPPIRWTNIKIRLTGGATCRGSGVETELLLSNSNNCSDRMTNSPTDKARAKDVAWPDGGSRRIRLICGAWRSSTVDKHKKLFKTVQILHTWQAKTKATQEMIIMPSATKATGNSQAELPKFKLDSLRSSQNKLVKIIIQNMPAGASMPTRIIWSTRLTLLKRYGLPNLIIA